MYRVCGPVNSFYFVLASRWCSLLMEHNILQDSHKTVIRYFFLRFFHWVHLLKHWINLCFKVIFIASTAVLSVDLFIYSNFDLSFASGRLKLILSAKHRKVCKNRAKCTVLIQRNFPYWFFTAVLPAAFTDVLAVFFKVHINMYYRNK